MALMSFSLKSGTEFFLDLFIFLNLACAHMHTFMLILRVVSIRIHFLLVDTDYSKSLFIFNTFKSSHKSDDIKANSSFVLFNSRQRFF